MKVRISVAALCLALLAPLGSQADPERVATSQAKAPKRTGMPKFTPTNLGTPNTRLGGATRGRSDSLPRTEALVPEQSGQTLEAQPVVYWYLSDPTDTRIDFAIIGVDPINPILETTLKGPFEAGIQRIRVADHGVELAPGVDYQWFLRVVPNPEQRLYDRVVGGGIERIEVTPELEAQLAAAHIGDAYYALAEGGVWYDALDSISVQIDADPENETLLSQRAALFDQVGLENLN
jgi:hypothetical protein